MKILKLIIYALLQVTFIFLGGLLIARGILMNSIDVVANAMIMFGFAIILEGAIKRAENTKNE